jgi:membrane-bound inhibitor of C-type lysozyme
MKKLIGIVLATTLLAGCGMTASEVMRKGDDQGMNTFRYQCRGIPLVVTVDQIRSEARALIDGGVRVLPQVVSASGATYSDGVYTFASKGDKAMVTKGNQIILDNCELKESN